MCVECQFIDGVDCTDAGKTLRQQRLDALWNAFFGSTTVSAVADRGRSISYRDPEKMLPAIGMLQREQYLCANGQWPPAPGRRYLAPPAVIKAL